MREKITQSRHFEPKLLPEQNQMPNSRLSIHLCSRFMECGYSTRHARLYTILSVALQSSIPARVDVTRKLDFAVQDFARPIVRFRLSARTSSRQDLMPAVIYDLTVRSIRPVDFNFNSLVFDSTLIDLRKNDEF